MCVVRKWNYIEILNIRSDGRKFVTAMRSDMKAFLIPITDASTVEKFIETLEEFRNCKCSHEAPCDLHKTNQGELKDGNINQKR